MVAAITGAGVSWFMSEPFHGIAIGGYIPGESPLHRLDPRTKLIGLLLLVTVVFISGSSSGVIVNGAVTLGLAAYCRVGWKIWWWGLRRFAWMLGIVAVTHVLINRWGTPIHLVGRELPFTVEGLESSLLFTARLAEAVILSMIVTFTTTPRELTRAFERFVMPLKRFNAHVEELGIVLLLALRFLPLLQWEVTSIVEAQKARGVEFGRGGILSRSRNLTALFIPVLTGTLTRGDRLATAMTARGFRPGLARSEYRPLEWSKPDYVAGLFLAAYVPGRILLFG